MYLIPEDGYYNRNMFYVLKRLIEFVVRTALFWAITQQVVVISYRRFGTNYRSYLQGSRIQILLDFRTLRMGLKPS